MGDGRVLLFGGVGVGRNGVSRAGECFETSHGWGRMPCLVSCAASFWRALLAAQPPWRACLQPADPLSLFLNEYAKLSARVWCSSGPLRFDWFRHRSHGTRLGVAACVQHCMSGAGSCCRSCSCSLRGLLLSVRAGHDAKQYISRPCQAVVGYGLMITSHSATFAAQTVQYACSLAANCPCGLRCTRRAQSAAVWLF